MEFGKLPEIENVDWSLPETDARSWRFLESGPKPGDGKTRFLIGTPAWGHRDWIGKIYPPRTPAGDFLSHYSRSFGCIEFNSVHYRIPGPEQIAKWIQKVPDSFVFCPKVFNGISHSLEGLADPRLLGLWLESLPHYGKHLGPCFLQLPPHFDYSKKAALFHFLQRWPDDFELAIEFRHPSWLTPGRQILPALGEYLRERGMGLVITDVAGRRDILHTSITAPFTMLRFIGNDLHPSDFSRSKAWAGRFQDWQEAGLSRAYFFVHEPEDVNAPEMAGQVIRDLREACGAVIPDLQWVAESAGTQSAFPV